jgi:hypothetical protein
MGLSITDRQIGEKPGFSFGACPALEEFYDVNRQRFVRRDPGLARRRGPGTVDRL